MDGRERAMKVDRQKLTAYALGELQGAEAREVEESLRSDAAARRYVEEIRGAAQAIERDLRAEPLPGGRGADPVIREVARRQATRPSVRRAWLQAGAIGALIVLFTLALPLRERFGGSVAHVFGLGGSTGTSGGTAEDSRPDHRTMKADPRTLQADVEGLIARSRLERAFGYCQLSIPTPAPGDRLSSDGASYILIESGIEVSLRIRSAPQPLVHGEGVEEVGAVNSGSLFRLARGDQSVEFYVVPENPLQPYCSVAVESDWVLPEPFRKAVAPAFEELGRSMAETLVVRTPK
jgi:hypothetical protein